MDKMEMMDDMEEDAGEPSAPVDESYISEMSSGAGALIPEDFTAMNLKVPTQAADGESVSVVLTGTAKGGFIQNVYGAEIAPVTEKPKGRIKSALGGTEEEN